MAPTYSISEPEPATLTLVAPPRLDLISARAFAFTDVVGSAALAEELGDRRFAAIIRAHNAAVRAALRGRGAEAHFLGDGFMVDFDGAPAAIAWAVAVQRAVAVLREATGVALHVRIGAHAGTAVREQGTWLGRDVIVARRLCERARADEILVSRCLLDLAGAAAPDPRRLDLKGLSDPQPVCRLAWAQ